MNYKYYLNNEIKAPEIKKFLIEYLIDKNVFTEETLYDFFSNSNEQNKIKFLTKFGDTNKKIIKKSEFFVAEESDNLKYVSFFQK